MKRILCAVVVAATLATPAFAAKLYLKDGGYIKAKRVWRADGRVYVLATRDTLTSFEKSEVNMKRTFPKKPVVAKAVEASAPETAKAAPAGTAAPQKPAEPKAGVTLPSLPKIPQKSPENLVPSSGSGGAIKQQKKNMAEKLNE
jgi:hypothetical protein